MAGAAAPLARDAITGLLTLAIVVASLALIVLTRVDTLWVMLGAAIAGFLSFQL